MFSSFIWHAILIIVLIQQSQGTHLRSPQGRTRQGIASSGQPSSPIGCSATNASALSDSATNPGCSANHTAGSATCLPAARVVIAHKYLAEPAFPTAATPAATAAVSTGSTTNVAIATHPVPPAAGKFRGQFIPAATSLGWSSHPEPCQYHDALSLFCPSFRPQPATAATSVVACTLFATCSAAVC